MTAASVLFPLAAFLRWASRLLCLIVVVSFAFFAVGQTSTASTHQQNELSGTVTRTQPAHKSAVHRVIEEASGTLTSPFSAITSGSSSQWVVRGVGTLMALLVYGVGIGYVARVMRIRV
jgi:hypothetical protein